MVEFIHEDIYNDGERKENRTFSQMYSADEINGGNF